MKNTIRLLLPALLCLLLLAGCGGREDIQIGEPFEERYPFLAGGALQVTVKSARRITDAGELPPEEMFLEYYDKYVTPEGTMREGGSFVLLDLEVKNLDAAVDTGEYEDGDPYRFRADGLLTLVDITDKRGGNYSYIPVDYFSLYGQDPEHVFAFRLQPGETVGFQVGFFLGGKPDGSERDLSKLRAGTGISTKSDLIDLDLEADADE